MRASSRRLHSIAAILAVGFFVNVHLRIRPDGSGKLLVTYPANPLTSHETESARFHSPVSELTGLSIRDRIAHSRVRFSNVTRLSEAPELQNTVVAYEADGAGGGLLSATIRGAIIFAPESTNVATVDVECPGRIVEANTPRISNVTARWEAPIAQFFSSDGIPIVARFTSGATQPPTQNGMNHVPVATAR